LHRQAKEWRALLSVRADRTKLRKPRANDATATGDAGSLLVRDRTDDEPGTDMVINELDHKLGACILA
jgi:hypothetical protein